MRKIFCISVMFVVVLWSVSAAASVSIVATVDRNEITLDDSIYLNISVEGTKEKPVLPDMPGFNVQSRGTSSNVSIINGQMSSSMEYSYVLYPVKPGSFILGPFTVEDNGKTVKSNLINIRVVKSQAPKGGNEKAVFITTEVDNDKPYLYEEIIYTFRFYRSVKVANARLTDSPDFDGFMSEVLGRQREYRTVINGKAYIVTEIKHALFPARTGVLNIPPSTLYCDVVVQRRRRSRGGFADPFFNDPFFSPAETRPRHLKSSPITVMVKPLPVEGKPKGFDNLVGDFTLSSSVSKRKVKKGDSITLTITVSGTGNLKNHQNIVDFHPEGFKTYNDKPVFVPSVINGRLGGKLTVKKAIVPLKQGPLTIPPVVVSFFDPGKRIYKTLKTKPCKIKVLPSDEKENLNVVELPGMTGSKQDVKYLGHDILPVHTSMKDINSVKLDPLCLPNLFLFLFPIAVLISCAGIKRSRRKNLNDSGLLRSKNAFKQFKKKLPGVKSLMQVDEMSFYSSASKALKDFIGDKLNITGSALTAEEIKKRLSGRGIPEAVQEEVNRLIDFFESGQFGFKKHDDSERQSAYDDMIKIVKTLNRKLGK